MTVCPLKFNGINDVEVEEEEKKMITWKDTLSETKKQKDVVAVKEKKKLRKLEKPIVTEEFLEDLKINKNLLKTPRSDLFLAKYKNKNEILKCKSEKCLRACKIKEEIRDMIDVGSENEIKNCNEDLTETQIEKIESCEFISTEKNVFKTEEYNCNLIEPLIINEENCFDEIIIEPPLAFQNGDNKVELIEDLITSLEKETITDDAKQNVDKLCTIYQEILTDDSNRRSPSRNGIETVNDKFNSEAIKSEDDKNHTKTILEPREWDFDDMESLTSGAPNKWTEALSMERLNKGSLLKSSHSDVCIESTKTKQLIVTLPSILDKRDRNSAPPLFSILNIEPIIPQKRRKIEHIENNLHANINVIKKRKQQKDKVDVEETPRFKELLNFLTLTKGRNDEEMLTVSRKHCEKLLHFNAKASTKLPEIYGKGCNNNNKQVMKRNEIKLPPLKVVCKEKRLVKLVGENFIDR